MHRFPQSNWKEVAKEVKSRTHEQCLQRWKKVLAPGLIKGQWTPEEDQLLLSAVAVNEGGKHKNWGTVSNRIPGRTSKQVSQVLRVCCQLHSSTKNRPRYQLATKYKKRRNMWAGEKKWMRGLVVPAGADRVNH